MLIITEHRFFSKFMECADINLSDESMYGLWESNDRKDSNPSAINILFIVWIKRFKCTVLGIFLCSHMRICSYITDKIDIPEIIKYPDNSKYIMGSSVTLTCKAQGNPSPDTSPDQSINKYVWTFKANSEENATELVSVNGKLELIIVEESDRGVYTCIAFNGFNGKAFNNSADIQLQILGKFPIECYWMYILFKQLRWCRMFTLQAEGRMFESWFPQTLIRILLIGLFD